MPRITITGVEPFDGSYSFDDDRQFNGNELHLIKQVAGLRLGEIEEALEARDYDLIICVAAIGVWRAGKVTKDTVGALVGMLLAADTGSIVIEDDGGSEAEQDDPPSAAPSERGSSGADNVSSLPSSKGSSSIGDAHQGTTRRATGQHG